MSASESSRAVLRANYVDGWSRDSWEIEIYDNQIKYQGPNQGIIEGLLDLKRSVSYDSSELLDSLRDEVQHVASPGSWTGIDIYFDGDERSRVTYDKFNTPPEEIRENLRDILRRVGVERKFESILDPGSE